jgi:hypothetical protein
MNRLWDAMVVTMLSAILLASPSCSVQPPPKAEEKVESGFCHADSECDPKHVCNKDLGWWRPVATPADAGVCIEPVIATCPKGSVLSAGTNRDTQTTTSFCAAGPTICHRNEDCNPPDKCDKHTVTFIPLSAGPGAGVCMVGN